MQYRTRQSDQLDLICQQFYRRVDVLPQVLDANPHLADYGATLPAGLLIELPKISEPVQQGSINVWD